MRILKTLPAKQHHQRVSSFCLHNASYMRHMDRLIKRNCAIHLLLQLINCEAKAMFYPKMMPLNKLHQMKISCNLSLKSRTIHYKSLPRNCWLIDQKQYRNHIPRMLQTIPHHRKPTHQPHRPVSIR